MSQESAERLRLDETEPVVQAVVAAIHSGDEDALRGLLERRPGLAGALFRSAKGGSRTALHVVTDWPGFFPKGPAIVAASDRGRRGSERPRRGELARGDGPALGSEQ